MRRRAALRNPWQRKKEFMAWEEYEELVGTLELFAWQQATRKQSLKNALANA